MSLLSDSLSLSLEELDAELILDNYLWFIANWACDALVILAGSNPPKTLSELSLESESIRKSYTL